MEPRELGVVNLGQGSPSPLASRHRGLSIRVVFLRLDALGHLRHVEDCHERAEDCKRSGAVFRARFLGEKGDGIESSGKSG